MRGDPDVGARTRTDAGRLVNAKALWPVLAAVVAFAVTAIALAWAAHAPPRLKLQLAFSENACCSWQVWVNGARSADITVLPITAGRSVVYSVPVWQPRLVRLRMPLGEVAGSSVTVQRVWVARGSRPVAEVGKAQLLRATTYDSVKRPTSGGIEIRAQGSHPFLDLPVSLDVRESSARLFLAKLVAQPLQPLVALLIIGVLVTLIVAAGSRRQALFVVVVGVTLLGVRTLPAVLGRITFHDDVSQAVSYSSYQGIAKSRERLIFELAVVLAFAVGAAFAFLARRFRSEAVPQVATITPLSRVARILLVAVPSVVVALAGMPNLRALIGAGRSVEYVPAWDSNNLTFWHYLIQAKHLAPMKDFFWPYGFQWIFDLAVPWGEVWSYLVYLSFWIYLAIGTYVALARFFSGPPLARRVVFVSGFWLSALLAGYAPFATRYVAPLSVLLLYAGLDSRDGIRSWKRLLFAVAWLELTLFEVAQMLYALVPIVFLLLVGTTLELRGSRAQVVAALARSTATIVLPLAAATLVYGAARELGGTVEYYSSVGGLTATYAWPGRVVHWIVDPDDLGSFVFWAVPIALALGTYGMLVRRDRSRLAYAVVAALGLLGVMVMQKQVLRPPVEAQIWPAVVFALVFWAAIDTSLHRLRHAASVAAFAGVAAALILVAGGYHRGWNTVVGAPERLVHSIGALAHQRGAFAADARAQFSPERFAKFTLYEPVVAALRRDSTVRAGGRVWVLGDDSPIVMMLGRSWPYYFSNLYDAAQIEFQKKVIDRLEQAPPARVVWNFSREALVFDTVPQPIRSPLLYQWTIARYVPFEQVGQIAILRPRHAGEAVPLGWWRQRIGSTLHLGAIPEAADLHGSSDCTRACSVYLEVRLGADRPGGSTAKFGVVVGQETFNVTFNVTSARRYVVRLDRLWFWRPGASVSRHVLTKTLTGAKVSVMRRAAASGVLY